MSAARPCAPWTNAARSISPRRRRAPGVRSAASSAGPAPRSQSASGESGSSGTSEPRRSSSAASAASGGRPRSRSSSARCSPSIHGTSASGAGVAITATRSTRSGRRAASASATRPPADQPATPTRPTLMPSSTVASSSAAAATVDHVPAATGDEPPYPGRSIESRRTFRARVTAGSGSKQPAPGALWQRTTAGSRTPRARPSEGNQATVVVVRWTATLRPDSSTKRTDATLTTIPAISCRVHHLDSKSCARAVSSRSCWCCRRAGS